MQCWICGSNADSSEHLAKASDVRAVFGEVNNHKPLFRTSSKDGVIRVNGVQSKPLKFEKSICQRCNNSRTANHDRAWEKLSEFLRNEQSCDAYPFTFDPKEVFGDAYSEKMTHVHLYFTKLFGCHAVEHKAPLPLQSMALAINTGIPHPQIFLTFERVPADFGVRKITLGPINFINAGRPIQAAHFHYRVSNVAVLVSYTEAQRPGAKLTWHPTDKTQRIRTRLRKLG